nr:MAG TPA: hypothetical protein [Caudoviricetes sp.]
MHSNVHSKKQKPRKFGVYSKLLTGFEPPKYIFANIRKKC